MGKTAKKIEEPELVTESVAIPDAATETLADNTNETNVIIEKEVNSELPETEPVKIESEVDFLVKLRRIQNEGGFGIHLNKIIDERIKLLG